MSPILITLLYSSILSILFLTGCQPVYDNIPTGGTSPPTTDPNTIIGVLTGFNQNFSMMPNLDNALIKNIQILDPQILRYPGGTVTHSWNWREGIIEKRNSSKVHPISEIKSLIDSTGADFIFVLDIANKSIEDQIEMLISIQELGVDIKYIELGNELYAQEDNYKEVFPTGKKYAEKVNTWVPQLKAKFPNAKIAALLSGRLVKESNTRLYYWNSEVVDNSNQFVDAFTYHIYINENTDFENEKNDFSSVALAAKTGNKPLWITEYGNKQDKSNPNYYLELSKLADFVETFPNVTIALNHQIVGGTKAKLSEDGKEFNEEGQLFLNRKKSKK
jgi:alpha-L-arabinofuranosidase